MLTQAGRRFRTLFISDVHLGARGCQADRLLDFLRCHDADTIYLVGDIVDGWQLRSAWFWPQAHNDVVQKLLRKARKGSRVIYVPGNHDEFLRDYCGTHFGGIEVVETAIHESACGKRYLVIHGDLFDLVVTQARWLALLGSKAYDWAILLNRAFNAVRRRLGFPYWSLSQWLKLKVKNAVNFIGEFEKTLIAEARRREVEGVICGHIHHAAMHEVSGVRYLNCGDWVESCTAIVEHADGRFEIITWTPDVRLPEPVAEPSDRGEREVEIVTRRLVKEAGARLGISQAVMTAARRRNRSGPRRVPRWTRRAAAGSSSAA
jgi:UDP-2,3-diacylglucosamine pyrophosphatase LpxH